MKAKKIEKISDAPMYMSVGDIMSLGFSRGTTYKLLNNPDMPVIKIGKRRFVNRDKLFQLLENQTGKEA